MKWRLPDWRSMRTFMRLRLAALASSANAQLAKVLRPKVARVLAVLLFFSVIAVGAHAATMSASVTLSAPPNDLGLVGYWPFDSATTNFSTGKTTDLSGYNNTGTMVNMTHSSLEVPGQLGQALSFNGTSQYVSLASVPVTGTESFSIFSWVKPVGNGSRMGIMTFGGSGCDTTEYLFIYANRVQNDLSCQTGPHSAVTVTDGKWHYVGVVNNAGSFQIYVDGLPSGNPATLSPNLGSSVDNAIGQNFLGPIDDVRIYNRALSATEVQQMYDAGLPGVGSATRDASPTSLVTNGLVGYWTFDGQNTNWNTDTTADVSGKGNTGKLINMSTTTSPVLGRFGQALSFNGTSQYVSASAPINFATSPWTVTMWAKHPLNSAWYSRLFSDESGGGYSYNQCATINLSPTNNAAVYFTSNSKNLVSGSVPNPTQWNMYTMTWDGTTLHGYVDDVNQGSSAVVGGSYICDASHFRIGTENYLTPPTDGFLDGSIDDVRIYNRALTQTEVTQLYNAGAIGATIDTAPAQALSGGGLVGYWPFDGNKMNWASSLALDASGNGNNGTLVNMTTANAVMGVIGQALSFNGTSQYVTIPSLDSFHTDYITLSAWVRTSTTGTYSAMVEHADVSNGATQQFQFRVSNTNKIEFITFKAANTYVDLVGATTITDGKWHLVTGTWDGTTVKVYVDGKLDGSTPQSGTLYTVTEPFEIGSVYNSDTGYNFTPFNGSIDDVRIYNRALSASEVKQLYNLGR